MPVERAFLADAFVGWSTIAQEMDLPKEEKQFWLEQEYPDAPVHIINLPDFFWREGSILGV